MTYGLNYETDSGQLSINGVNMRCSAWHLMNLYPLWATARVRGRDRIIPGASGVLPNRRRRTVTEHSLTLAISGEVDVNDVYAGPTVAEQAEQMEENINYLRTNVADPTGTGDGTRAAILTMPSGATRTGNIHVLDLEIDEGSAESWLIVATLVISIPGGVLT